MKNFAKATMWKISESFFLVHVKVFLLKERKIKRKNNKWQKIKKIVYFSLNYFDVACKFNDESEWSDGFLYENFFIFLVVIEGMNIEGLLIQLVI